MIQFENRQSKTIRCAIYTRKSCEEGLDLEFNSLDAQRESAEAFIASQQHEGWVCSPELYDDGGFSGGDMERPALNRLMKDIEAGKIDCVVVYKVDRLSRSLLDFARIMSTFDAHEVSFVSVTQQFNTTHSMGRLTLNILLSFAQFEREIIGERIRDKLAAQRRRGKWAGGIPVLGYDVDRSNASPKLVINAEEAKRVRRIFELYLKLGSLLPVVEALTKRNWANKTWTTRRGLPRGGRPFDKTSLHSLLTNPIYNGKIRHKHELHQGEHEAIIAPAIFERVQTQLKHNGKGRGNHLANKHGALLKGLIHCKACGYRMVHTFSGRGTKRYRYYKCSRAIKCGYASCPSPALPAREIEAMIVDQVRRIAQDSDLQQDVLHRAQQKLDDEATELDTQRRQLEKQKNRDRAELDRLVSLQSSSAVTIERIAQLQHRISQADEGLATVDYKLNEATGKQIDESAVSGALQDFDSFWGGMTVQERVRFIALLIDRIDFDASDTSISVSFQPAALKSLASLDRSEVV